MPTTDLPQTTTVRGSAGFKWFPNGSTNRPEQVHALNYPPELIPGGGLESADRKFRAQSRSIDGSNLETWTVGGSTGTEEITLRVRFDGWPESLLDLVGDAHDGVTIDYYPRLESTNLSFPSELLGVEDVARIREDEDRFSHAEYQADLRLKDASSDSQGYWWLKSPNKLKNPRLARGTTDGVAEEWVLSGDAGHTVDASMNSRVRAQKLAITGATTSFANTEIRQDLDGVVPSDVLEVSVDVRQRSKAGTGKSRIDVRFLSDSSTQVGRTVRDTTNIGASTDFRRVTVSTTSAGTATKTVRVGLQVVSNSTDDRIDAWFRDAELTLQ